MALLAGLVAVPPGAPVAAQTEEGTASPEWAGVWKATRTYGPQLEGTLTLHHRADDPADGWRAELAEHSAPVLWRGDEVSFEMGAGGSFRGRKIAGEGSIVGHWIQPATDLSVAYASPVELRVAGPGRWRGEVVPLPERMTMFLVLREREDGELDAFVRNHQRNAGRFLGLSRAVPAGAELQFLNGEGNEVLPPGRWDADAGRLVVSFPYGLGSFDFAPVEDLVAAGFAPRATAQPYRYRPPVAGSGWGTATPAEVGMTAEPLGRLVEELERSHGESVRSLQLHALLVARHGRLVVEEYFHGYHRDLPHDTRSASKSLTTTLVGVAQFQGAGFAVQDPAYELLGEEPPTDDPRHSALTVEHLLTMSSGLACDDNDPDSPGNEGRMQSQDQQPDWIRYTLDLPMVREPGTEAAYCSAGINLLGEVLRRSVSREGLDTPTFFHRHFAEPLGLGRYYVNLMPTGDAYLGGGLRLLPRDFLKLGQMMIDGGVWQGRRQVSEDWVRRALAPRVSLNDQQYGYGWWVIDHAWSGRRVRTVYAGGNGGQLLMMVPELDLVALFLAGNYGDFQALLRFRDETMERFILPMVRATAPEIAPERDVQGRNEIDPNE